MKIIIAGDGKVGSMLAYELSNEGHDVTIIDNNPEALENTIEHCDVMSVTGNCAAMDVLRSAGVEEADLLITSTASDELNLLCCMTAHGMNSGLHTIARIRTPDYRESVWAMRKLFALSLTVNPERMCAQEIDRILRYPVSIRRERFANGHVEIVELKIEKGNKLCDQKMKDLQSIISCRILVCTVLRDGKPVTPTGDFVIREGDRLYVTAPAKNLSLLLKNVGVPVPKIRNVTIIGGGGRNGYYLTQILLGENINVKIIEKNYARCEQLADDFPDATIIHGDAAHTDVLEAERIENSDAVVVMTGMDELNLILSIYARNKKVPQVVTKLGRAENLDMLENLPIGAVVSPKLCCCDVITNYVRAMQQQVGAAVTTHPIADGHSNAYEFIADTSTKHTGVPLRDIRVRSGALIASISRGKNPIIPNGDSIFQPGDRIVVVAPADSTIRQLNDIFEA